MNAAITTNLITHLAIVRNGKEERKIPLTSDQYAFVKMMKQDAKSTEIIAIASKDTGKMLYEGELGSIREFEEVQHRDTTGIVYVCEFGTRHQMHETCECNRDFRVSLPEFKKEIDALFGKGIGKPTVYSTQITRIMRDEAIANIRKRG